MRFITFAVASTSLMFALSGCSDRSSSLPPNDTGSDGPADVASDPTSDSGDDGAVEPDGDVIDDAPLPEPTRETARPLVIDAPAGVTDAIDPAGDLDFYAIEVEEGQWIALYTEANRDWLPDVVDPVLTLFDESGGRVAENDDAYPLGILGADAEIITRIPSAGTYYVRVQDWSTWSNETPRGGPDFTYRLFYFSPDELPMAAFEAVESGDDLASAANLELGDTSVALGTFRDVDDVDVYRFTLDEETPVQADVTRATNQGNGSTTRAGSFWVVDDSDSSIVAQSNQAEARYSLFPVLSAGDYQLWITHPGDGLGTNDFYVLKLLLGDDESTVEAADESNDDRAGAEPLSFVDTVGDFDQANLLTFLSGDDDVDHYSFEIDGAQTADIVCGAYFFGSGVLGLHIELLTSDGAGINSADESIDAPAEHTRIANESLSEAGTYYIRFSKTGQVDTVTSDYVRCSIWVSNGE